MKETETMYVGKIGLQKSLLGVLFASIAVWIVSLLLAVCAPPSQAAEAANQTTFRSAEEAADALFLAAKSHDEQAQVRILGGGTELISSDDELQDRLDREQFAQKYHQMHRLGREGKGVALLYVGAENWPFPIPLVSQNGGWRFDTDAGMQEIKFRRIGENELTAIALSRALLARENSPQMAEANDGAVAAVLAAAKNGDPAGPIRGYYFRTLADTDHSFAIVAYPAEYRSSGVMTFIVNSDQVVREKDLGSDTARIARGMIGYGADSTWKPTDAL
jgi:hypothetical protein